MEAALKEALRVFPTAPTLVREAAQALNLGGYALEKGQILAVSAYSMHHNPAYWAVRARPTADMEHAQAWMGLTRSTRPRLSGPGGLPA